MKADFENPPLVKIIWLDACQYSDACVESPEDVETDLYLGEMCGYWIATVGEMEVFAVEKQVNGQPYYRDLWHIPRVLIKEIREIKL